MPVLSVDLAYRSWADLGVVILDRRVIPTSVAMSSSVSMGNSIASIRGAIQCEIVDWEPEELGPLLLRSPVDPEVLAERLHDLANVRGVRVLMLDGPQAWKSSSNELEHARISERQLNCACKTGLPGGVKPATYRAFAEFCVDVYDALCRRGWRRLDTNEKPYGGPDRVLVESYPHAAWKSLGIGALPSKRRARPVDVAESLRALNAVVPLTVNRTPNHDQLQAIVGGLPGLALAGSDSSQMRIVGAPPRREDGHWREGFIVLPIPPTASLG